MDQRLKGVWDCAYRHDAAAWHAFTRWRSRRSQCRSFFDSDAPMRVRAAAQFESENSPTNQALEAKVCRQRAKVIDWPFNRFLLHSDIDYHHHIFRAVKRALQV